MGSAWAEAKKKEAEAWLAAQAAWHVAAVAEAEARKLEACAHEAAARACQARADEVRSRIPTHKERGIE